MEAALYDPEAGFYSRRKPTEDFYTAPELHPAFGGIVAREIARRLQALKERGVAGPYALVEMGSGSGLLARQVLEALRRDQPGLSRGIRYILVERCREKLLESVLSLSSGPERILGYSRLEEMLPCTGVFLSNELVDSFPVHLLEKKGGEVREVYVDEAGEASLGELSSRELEGPARAVAASLAEGERHAVNLEAARWLKAVAEKLKPATC
jgi:SAM-dependent MidA family methyltransferase